MFNKPLNNRTGKVLAFLVHIMQHPHYQCLLVIAAKQEEKSFFECCVGDFRSLRNLNLALGLFYNLNFKQTQKDFGSLGNARLEFQYRLDYLGETTQPCSERLSNDGHF